MQPESEIPFNKPFVPPLDEVTAKIRLAHDRAWFTNHGDFAKTLQQRLTDFAGGEPFLLTSNGTLALQLMIRAFGLNGKKVATTPISYVATASSLAWEGCTPVFIDIEKNGYNMCPESLVAGLEAHPDVAGILPVHCFGFACETERLQAIADKHEIPLLYDAAHCSDVLHQGKPLVTFGNASAISLHATKYIHTIEGGGIYCSDERVIQRLRRMRNFGHDGPAHFSTLGINAKMSEYHAAAGLVILDQIQSIRTQRRLLVDAYDECLGKSGLFRKKFPEGWNGAYMPVVFDSEDELLSMEETLRTSGIGSRRYFYPALHQVAAIPSIVGTSVEEAESLASRILCLPIHHYITVGDVERIAHVMQSHR
jgi:dTDP-4-amino-4,6-dideoxygalactose transaminase